MLVETVEVGGREVHRRGPKNALLVVLRRPQFKTINDAALENYVGENNAKQLRADIELIDGVYSEFDINEYLDGKVAPVFFGSAVNNFGVKELLEAFIRIAPPPKPRETTLRVIEPDESKFSGFVFSYS